MRPLDTQKGQVLVMSALVMAFLFLPLSVFVIDTARKLRHIHKAE